MSQVINGEKRHFYLPYDKLIIGVGSKTNTHGVKGLEYCDFLKTIDDARAIRKRAIGNFEKAVLPTTTDEERKRLLSFVICGGGPTGIEFAAEIYDMLNEDLVRHVSPANIPDQTLEEKSANIFLIVPPNSPKRGLSARHSVPRPHLEHIRRSLVNVRRRKVRP